MIKHESDSEPEDDDMKKKRQTIEEHRALPKATTTPSGAPAAAATSPMAKGAKRQSTQAERWETARATRNIAGYDAMWAPIIRTQAGKLRTR